MKHYLVTWHETDSNDVTVYDTVIAAESKEEALDRLAQAIAATLEENGQPFSDDGNVLGFYFDCGEDCDDQCEGHGGIALREVEEYATEDAAREAMATYHVEWRMPE